MNEPIDLGMVRLASRPSTDDVLEAARIQRAAALGTAIAAAFAALRAAACRALAHRRQRRDAAATYSALRELDDRSLHDLGLDRSELTSLAAESAGNAEPTRLRAVLP